MELHFSAAVVGSQSHGDVEAVFDREDLPFVDFIFAYMLCRIVLLTGVEYFGFPVAISDYDNPQ